MSLQLIAKQMEAKGRKGDSMLVHMTPGEVAGLQKLAEAAGGSLTVNPETGLVEANFLKRVLESNFLPTVVGMGVGAATLNPYAGAAAGAAVGGAQAKRNDQDVFTGAALGGISGFGAGSIGSSLTSAGATGTAAQAISNPALAGQQVATGAGSQASMLAAQNAGFGAQGTASLAQAAGAATPSTAAQIGQGISALGTEAGRGAFMQGVGGGAGLLTDASMAAAAPMMAPGKAPGPAPVDDEMYSYEYNPGRTGAERDPMATTAERAYFDGSYSPLRKIKASQYGAAQGGLMSLAEGGTTTAPSGTSSEGMTGASKAAFDYLMGRADTTAFKGQGPGRGSSGKFGGDGMYSFDPATGLFTRNPNYVDPEELERRRQEAAAAAAAAAEARAARESGGGGAYEPLNVNYPGGGSYEPSNQPYEWPGDDSMDFGNEAHTTGWNDPSFNGMTEAQVSELGGGVGAAQGGLLGLAKGGMRSGGFVIPADVVSMIGEGNTDAGYKRIKSIIPGATAIKGKDGGQADTVKTHIEGKQPARVAHGEMYIPPETVKRMGGAKKLYAMMDRVRQQATGSKKQIKPVSLKRALA